VYFSGVGWVPFYPLPRPGSAAGQQAVRSLGEPGTRSALDQAVARAAAARGSRTGPPARVKVPSPAGPAGGMAVTEWALVSLCTLGALAASYLLMAAVARTLVYRRRRRHPDPRYRVAGAWRDALGGIRTAGSTPVARLTAQEIAAQGTALLGPAARQPLQRLADMANAALFAPAEPADADADAAWADAAQVRRLAWRRARWRSRAVVLLLPVRR
jgi:hypothetical protein